MKRGIARRVKLLTPVNIFWIRKGVNEFPSVRRPSTIALVAKRCIQAHGMPER
jgi:hypothetical protein